MVKVVYLVILIFLLIKVANDAQRIGPGATKDCCGLGLRAQDTIALHEEW